MNLSKSQISFGLGPKGANVNIAPRKRRTTLGLPGTGLSYVVTKRATSGDRRLYKLIWVFVIGCGLAGMIGLLVALSLPLAN